MLVVQVQIIILHHGNVYRSNIYIWNHKNISKYLAYFQKEIIYKRNLNSLLYLNALQWLWQRIHNHSNERIWINDYHFIKNMIYKCLIFILFCLIFFKYTYSLLVKSKPWRTQNKTTLYLFLKNKCEIFFSIFILRKWSVLYCQVGRWLSLFLASIFGIFGGLNAMEFEAYHTWPFPYFPYSKMCCLHLFFLVNCGGE